MGALGAFRQVGAAPDERERFHPSGSDADVVQLTGPHRYPDIGIEGGVDGATGLHVVRLARQNLPGQVDRIPAADRREIEVAVVLVDGQAVSGAAVGTGADAPLP